MAESGIGAWGDSNWSVPRALRRESTLLMNSLAEDIPSFEKLLVREQPNLLLIGAMTMSFPGAIECAKLARQMFGQKIFIVLGGRHANETVYTDRFRSTIRHHNGSPLKLMSEGIIDQVFDLVVSGEAEFLIAQLGELVANSSRKNIGNCLLSSFVLENLEKVSGDWIAGYVDNTSIKAKISRGIPIDRNRLPTPSTVFGVRSGFDIFNDALTGHAFSEMSSGCIYDCDFCSERVSVCGKPRQIETSAQRLYSQLVDIYNVIKEDSPSKKASAFVEDSIILNGIPSQLMQFASLLRMNPIDIEFGGQLTIDRALKVKSLAEDLTKGGLKYVFVGLETFDPNSIGGMSKDIGKEAWMERSERMICEYSDMGISVGTSILFGLGESQHQRMSLLSSISSWQEKYGNPITTSFNWAVQHPLKGNDNSNYEYHQWAIDYPDYVAAFKDFGEASTNYPISGVKVPTLQELSEISSVRRTLLKKL